MGLIAQSHNVVVEGILQPITGLNGYPFDGYTLRRGFIAAGFRSEVIIWLEQVYDEAAVAAYMAWLHFQILLADELTAFAAYQVACFTQPENPSLESVFLINIDILEALGMHHRRQYERLGYMYNLAVAASGSGATPVTDTDDSVGLTARGPHTL